MPPPRPGRPERSAPRPDPGRRFESTWLSGLRLDHPWVCTRYGFLDLVIQRRAVFLESNAPQAKCRGGPAAGQGLEKILQGTVLRRRPEIENHLPCPAALKQ